LLLPPASPLPPADVFAFVGSKTVVVEARTNPADEILTNPLCVELDERRLVARPFEAVLVVVVVVGVFVPLPMAG
jgi:hypothetical protein